MAKGTIIYADTVLKVKKTKDGTEGEIVHQSDYTFIVPVNKKPDESPKGK